MRRLYKKSSTKSERKFYEILKEMKVSFKHRWIIQGFEVDFLVKNYAIEINGHIQNTKKNEFLAELGYIPIHLSNNEITREKIINLLKNI